MQVGGVILLEAMFARFDGFQDLDELAGHLRYGTFGKNTIESVHPFLRQNNWVHRNLIVAGNFNLTNVNELFDNLVTL